MRHYTHVGITFEVRKTDNVFEKLSILSYAVDQIDMVNLKISYTFIDHSVKEIQDIINTVTNSMDYREIYMIEDIVFYPNEAMIPSDAPESIVDAHCTETEESVTLFVPFASLESVEATRDAIIHTVKGLFKKDLLSLKVEEVVSNQSYKDRRTAQIV